jgi:hypothetical protein
VFVNSARAGRLRYEAYGLSRAVAVSVAAVYDRGQTALSERSYSEAALQSALDRPDEADLLKGLCNAIAVNDPRSAAL